MSNKKIFTKDYFTQYYFPFTGSFSVRDLVRNRRWFAGWFKAIDQFFDFQHGRNRKVLEVGCSIGAAASLLAERGFTVTATDISSYAVKKARKIVPNVEFEVLDIETPKKHDSEFDLAFAFEVIEHLNNPVKALRNFRRMLKKNGVLICSTPYPYAYVFADVTHVNVRHPLDWVRLFTEAGFKDIQYKHVGFIPFFYRFSEHFHFRMPFGMPTRYVNSTIFIYAKK